MSKQFRRKDWKDCCAKGCKKCEIAQAYFAEYGRSDGLSRLEDDRATVLAAKGKGRKKKRKKHGKAKS